MIINCTFEFGGLEIIHQYNFGLNELNLNTNCICPVVAVEYFKKRIPIMSGALVRSIENSLPKEITLSDSKQLLNHIKNKVDEYNHKLTKDNYYPQIQPYFEASNNFYTDASCDRFTKLYFDIFINFHNKMLKSGINKVKLILENDINETELLNEWFNTMIDAEIKEVEGTIENENVFIDGSVSRTAINMHHKNIETYKSYIEMLKRSYKPVN